MYLVKSPFILTEFSKKSIMWKLKDEQMAIYLTFDDGPIPEVTPKVLKILAEYDAKATFFMVGENVQRYPDLLKQIQDEGHSIGNHTQKHINGSKHSDFTYYKSINEARAYIDSTLFRPPYGRISPRQIKAIKKDYQIVLWSVLSGDFDIKISPQKCLANVIKYTKDGSIIVFHDSLKAEERMIYALKGTLEHFSKLGYQFLAIKQK